MAKRVIQVPVEERLLKDLDSLSRRQHRARAALIREACQLYLLQVEQEEMESLYKQGYEKVPENAEVGEAQSAMVGEIVSRESW